MSRCDAEPGALAEYILALLKHNVPENEMRKELSSQLEEFLEKGAHYLAIAHLSSSYLFTRGSFIYRYIIHRPQNQVISPLHSQRSNNFFLLALTFSVRGYWNSYTSRRSFIQSFSNFTGTGAEAINGQR